MMWFPLCLEYNVMISPRPRKHNGCILMSETILNGKVMTVTQVLAEISSSYPAIKILTLWLNVDNNEII